MARTRKITQAPDALKLCNSCEVQPALANNPAGYCTECERTARAATARATCGCGCGESPKGKKARYLPGHDARFHAARRAAGQEVTYVTPAGKREKAAEAAKARRVAALTEANYRSDAALALQEADLVANPPVQIQDALKAPVPAVRGRKAKAS